MANADRGTSIYVQTETNARLQKLADGMRTSKSELLDAIAQFLEDQPESVKQAFASRFGDPVAEMVKVRMGDVAALSAAGHAPPVTVEKALEVIALMNKRIEQLVKDPDWVHQQGKRLAKKK